MNQVQSPLSSCPSLCNEKTLQGRLFSKQPLKIHRGSCVTASAHFQRWRRTLLSCFAVGLMHVHKGHQVIKMPLEQLRASWPGPGADLGTDLLLRASPGFQLQFQEGLASEGWECRPQAWPADLGGSWGSMSLLGVAGRETKAGLYPRLALEVPAKCDAELSAAEACSGFGPGPQWGWWLQKAGFSSIW